MKKHSGKKGNLDPKFSGFQQEPSDQVWENIEEKLNNETEAGFLGEKFAAFEVAPNPRSYRKVVAALWPFGAGGSWAGSLVGNTLQQLGNPVVRWSVAAGIALLLTFGGWWLLKNKNQTVNPENHIADSPVLDKGKEIKKSATQERNKEASQKNNTANSGNIISQDNNLVALENDQSPGKNLKNGLVQILDSNSIPNNSLIQSLESRSIDQLPFGWTLGWASRSKSQAWYDITTQSPELAGTKQKKPKEDRPRPEREAITLGYEPLLAFNTTPVGGTAGSGGRTFSADQAMLDGGGGGFQASSLESGQRKFSVPITIGGGLHFRLGKRFTLGPGIVYTRLGYTSSYNAPEGTTKTRNTEEFIGVSLSGGYDFFQKKNLGLYVTTGLQYDHGFRTRIASDGPAGKSSQTFSASEGFLVDQASVFAGLGAEYQIYSGLYLYAQASAANYFYQSGANYWSLSPVWPNLQAGLKFKL